MAWFPVYESSLSVVNKEDYTNAQKLPTQDEKIKFCIIVSSYNNIKYAPQNINSILRQDYHNWRMKYVDDSSSDGMSEVVKKIKEDSGLSDDKFTLERHKDRIKSAAYNLYEAAHNFCQDDEVLVAIDGDDMLAESKVLNKLADVYKDSKIWVTYGSYVRIPSGGADFNQGMKKTDDPTITRKQIYGIASHLRTAYTWLYKKINVEDLKYQGEFIQFAPDIATLYPAMEMAGKDRIKFIRDILYLYRTHENNEPAKEQMILADYIINLSPYKLIK